MSDEFKIFVRNGNWNNISEYQCSHSCKTDFWYLYYLTGLHKRYDKVLSMLIEQAKKIWLLETQEI